MKDQKKRKGFMHMFISCSCPLSHFQAWHPFHMGGFFIASESRLFPRVHSPPTGYSSGHPWRLVSISSSQCCWVILSDIPISLKIVYPEAYSLSSPSYQSPCVSLTLINIIYPCFVSIDGGYIKAFLRRISSCQPQHIIRERNLGTCPYYGTLETIFIIGGFPHGC